MKKVSHWICPVYLIAGVYDAGLGLLFLVAGSEIFQALEIDPPNHWGYVHFPASLLIVFGILFWTIAKDPVRHRVLIPFGIGLKICYCGTVFYHAIAGSIPSIWITFGYCDLVFAGAFFWSFVVLRKG